MGCEAWAFSTTSQKQQFCCDQLCLEFKSRKHTKQLEIQGLGQAWLWLFWWFLCQPRSWRNLSLLNVSLLTDVWFLGYSQTSLVIRDPRKLNLETDSTSLPSIMRGSSTLSGPMAMIFVLLTLRCRPSSSLSTLTLFKSSAMSAPLVAI